MARRRVMWHRLAQCAGVSITLAAVGAATHTFAAETARRGTILKIDDGRAIVDLGVKDGIREKTLVRLHKRYVLAHPVTGAKIEDELLLGEARVERVSDRIASVVLGDHSKAAIGDVVVLGARDEAPANSVFPRAAPAVSCGKCMRDEAAMSVHTAWLVAMREGLAGRVNVWKRFLSDNAASPYRGFVERELRFLAALSDQAPSPAQVDPNATADTSLEQVHEGEPLVAAIALPTRSERHLRAVYLYHRKRGAPLYARLEMRADGDGYFRATVPEAAVRRPGVDYYVEAMNAAGKATRVLASADIPYAVTVEAPPVRPDEKRGRSRLEINYTHVDFFVSQASRDFFWKMDASFSYRVGLGALEHFKLGFGFFEGFGGERLVVERVGAAAPLDSLAFGFAYLEPELALHEYFAILPRLTVGQLDRKRLAGTDAQRRTDQIFGGHLFMRIGRREGTHLLLGAGSTQDVGFETQITMNLGIWERTPVAFSALVSNVPVNRDLGLLLRGRVGRRIGDHVELGLHLGFAARNINHTGVDVGTSVAFTW